MTESQSKKSFEEFWDRYSDTEIKVYSDILENPSRITSGSFSELVDKYEADEALFMGFLDGINTSLKTPLELESVEHETAIALDVDFEKLYLNMLEAGADHLYLLDEWDDVLGDDKREEIIKDYKKSRTVVKEKTPGRNDPCSCGSGKKYKKCCGA